MSGRDPRKLAKELTRAQAMALRRAVEFDGPELKGAYPQLSVQMGVRGRLQAAGLLGKRPGHPLTKLGLEVREILRGEP